jgi:hypothetical protein
MLIENSVAAATAVVGYDLLQDQPNATIQPGQQITLVALKGSAAAGDSKVQITAGNITVAEIFNNAVGFPARDDLVPVAYVHPAGAGATRIYAKVTDAPASNPLNIAVVRIP